MATTTEREYKVVGTRPIRHDGVDKVTGRALYGADIRLPDMLHGRVLRSPHAHARIRSIDVGKARAHPGVKAVITADDLPDLSDKIAELGEGAVNLRYLSENALARDKVLYRGHAVAAVAAVSPHLAEEALALIEVEYEPLPCVLTAPEAMAEDAPILHPGMTSASLGDEDPKPTNIASRFQFKLGDLEKGFAEADVVVERAFDTATVHQGYIEPQNATALWNADGHLTIWCSTQGAFSARDQVAELLRIPVSRITVVPLEIGGGFGGKISVYLEPLAALLSRQAGHPVKMTMSRAEVFESTGPTSGSHIEVKMGATREGRLTAAHASLYYEAGAYPGSLVSMAATCILAPYHLENVTIDGYDVVVNKPKANAYRAPGATNAEFAAETVVDELCEQLGVDPLEFRIKNGAREGTRRADGPVWPPIGLIETAEAARVHEHYTAPLEGLCRGRGVASGFWVNAGLKSSAYASVNADGTVNLVEGSVDIGGTRASLAMQLAEVLGIAAEEVHPKVADTDSVGYNDVTGGSRTTFASGWAAYQVGQDILRQMIERAARIWDADPEEIGFQDGVFSHQRDPQKRLGFRELAAQLPSTGGLIVGRSVVEPRGVGGAFGTHIVDVEVDPETGKVTILRYTATQDVGTAIHPSYVEGQIQGGVAQGIGWALSEEYAYDEAGAMTNASFLDYRMPTSLDLPMIDTVLVEVPNPGHPFGVRGVGEVPIVPPPAAIANAIYRAVGVRMTCLPMSPARMLEALWEKGGE